MDFLELTKKRFSARNYKSDKVEQDKIDYIIECARLAPSAVNYQPWHFMVVISEEQKKKIQQCYNREWFAKAPVYIVVCADLDLLRTNFQLPAEKYPVAIIPLGYIAEQPECFSTRKERGEIVTVY